MRGDIATREAEVHRSAFIETPVALIGLNLLVSLVHLRNVDRERASAGQVGTQRRLLVAVHEASVEAEGRQEAPGLHEIVGRRQHRLTGTESLPIVFEQGDADVSSDNDVVQPHTQLAGSERLRLQHWIRQIAAVLEALNQHAQACYLFWMREEVSIYSQPMQGGCRGGDWWWRRWAVKPCIRPLQMLEHLVHVPDL